MPIARHRYAHTDARLPSARIPQFILCDREAELPTVDVGQGDIAYAKDSAKLLKRTASSWFEIAGSAPGTHASTHVENGTDEILAELLGTAEMVTTKVLKPDGAGGVAWGAAAGGTATMSRTFLIHNPPAGSTNYPLWEAEQATIIIKIRSYMIGSGSCGVNVTKNGASILGVDQYPYSTWASSSVLTVAVAAGDDINITIHDVAGTVSYVAVQVDFTVG